MRRHQHLVWPVRCQLDAQLTPLFAQALAYLLQNEGSDFVNHPDDHGGPTRWGITLASLAAYRGRATPEDVAALTREDAEAFYRDVYWLPLGLDQVAADAPGAAIALFDTAVLCGTATAVGMAQRATGVRADRIMGPATRAGIQAIGEAAFLCRFVPLVLQRFAAICEADPTQCVFLRAWVARASRLLGLVLQAKSLALCPAEGV